MSRRKAAIDGKPDDVTGPLLDPVLLPLWGAYGSLTRARAERAPLDLDLPERKIQLDERAACAASSPLPASTPIV